MLDRIDFTILDALQNNARMTNKELAARVGLAPSSCFERVRKLERDEIILGSHAEVDRSALGIQLEALISVRLDQQHAAASKDFETAMLALPEITAMYHLAGKDDYTFHVVVRSSEHLRQVVIQDIASRPEIQHVETNLIFDYVRAPTLPNFLEPSGG